MREPQMINSECKHPNEYPMIGTRITSTGREKKTSIWYCYDCKNERPREQLNLYVKEAPYAEDRGEDIRLINIISNHLGVSRVEAHEILKKSTEEHPIIYQGDCLIWNEE